MTAKDRLNRIKTVIKNGGVYRDYTDSTQAFNEDVEVVEQALTSYDELVKEHELTIKLFNSANEQLNELVKDVKWYLELVMDGRNLTWVDNPSDRNEIRTLENKLLKVVKEE